MLQIRAQIRAKHLPLTRLSFKNTRLLYFGLTRPMSAFKHLISISALAAIVGLLGIPAHGAEIIYLDDFSGSGASPLTGTTPDVSPGGETWSASGLFSADGSKTSNGTGNAFLPFSPQPGKVYRISADLNPDISTSSHWFALGFAQNNNTSSTFFTSPNDAGPWGLVRENDNGEVVHTFLGPGIDFREVYDPNPNLVGPINLAIELNTFQANWTTQWYVNGNLIRNNLNNFSTNPSITHIGLGALNQATGTIDNFLLAEIGKPVPEPSTTMILFFGAAALSLRRRLRTELLSRR